MRRVQGGYGAVAALALAAAGPCAAQTTVRMSDDYQAMMVWLTNEVVQGLAFNAGSAFDPPKEVRPWRMQPDVSLGLGVMPLNKGKFPYIRTRALAVMDPASLLPSHVMFPNLAGHVRLGLPGRMDFSVRGANMTIPSGYKLSPDTTGKGQSNSFGMSLRRHFLGEDDQPLVSFGLNYNHVFGHFEFFNVFKRLELVDGMLWADGRNTGRLDWDVRSYGANLIVSQTFRKWTPFGGAGYSHMRGSVSGRMRSDWDTPLAKPSEGLASDSPENHQVRAIFGWQRDGSWLHWFVNGELKLVGASAARTFILSTGLVAPFNLGASSLIHRRRGDPGEPGRGLGREDGRTGTRRPARRPPAPARPSGPRAPGGRPQRGASPPSDGGAGPAPEEELPEPELIR